MAKRRHHNTDGRRQIRRGKTRDQVAAMSRRLGIPVKTLHVTESFDAQVWAKAFVEQVAPNPLIATDEMTMVAWFASALMRGFDEHAKRNRDAAADLHVLREAIFWVLGERDSLGEEPPPLAGRWRRMFWWRHELRRRAGTALEVGKSVDAVVTTR